MTLIVLLLRVLHDSIHFHWYSLGKLNERFFFCTENSFFVSELKRTHGFSQNLLNYLMHIYSSMEDYWSSISSTDMNVGQQLLDEYILKNPDFTIPSFVANARCVVAGRLC